MAHTPYAYGTAAAAPIPAPNPAPASASTPETAKPVTTPATKRRAAKK